MKRFSLFGNNAKFLLEMLRYFKHDKPEAGHLNTENINYILSRIDNIDFFLRSMRDTKSESIFLLLPEERIKSCMSELLLIKSFFTKYKEALQSEEQRRQLGATAEECSAAVNASDTLSGILEIIYSNRLDIYAELTRKHPQGMAAIYRDMLRI